MALSLLPSAWRSFLGTAEQDRLAPMDVTITEPESLKAILDEQRSRSMDLTTLSFSQFAELMGIDDPNRIVGIGTSHSTKTVVIFLLPEDAHADNRHIASTERQREPAATAETER